MSVPAIDTTDSLSRLIPSRTARGFFLAVLSGIFFNFLNASVKGLATIHDKDVLIYCISQLVGALNAGRPTARRHTMPTPPQPPVQSFRA